MEELLKLRINLIIDINSNQIIMTILFHLRDPVFSDIFALISFILYLIAGILASREKRLKATYLIVVGSLAGILWFIVNFFIPGILLPSVPTPEELEFTLVYGTIFNGLIQDAVLLFSMGIVPIIITLKNRSSESIKFLATGALIQIISILISIGPDSDGLLSLPSLITTGIAMAVLSYYSYRLKYYFLIAFATTFFISRLFLVIIF
ncbi:MAG: hypothetical protein KGD74_00190 [Candidatus Lokiarchaeota archaeon]|nr:hypothetical protein [Candidatus Lokiarchaeota archaeon]